jgi:hypothetical protein
MTLENALARDRIRALNDDFRRSFVGGIVVVTAGFESLPACRRRSILSGIRAFDNFNEDNDPHGEHDFGLVDDGDVRCFWKIDYYDTDMELMSPDAAGSLCHDARPYSDAPGRILITTEPAAEPVAGAPRSNKAIQVTPLPPSSSRSRADALTGPISSLPNSRRRLKLLDTPRPPVPWAK